jgi:hypothetical protein
MYRVIFWLNNSIILQTNYTPKSDINLYLEPQPLIRFTKQSFKYLSIIYHLLSSNIQMVYM